MTEEEIRESVVTEEEKNYHGVNRTEKIFKMLKATIVDTQKENQHLKRIILDMQTEIRKHGACFKDQLANLRVNIVDLSKDLQFFKKEVIADALQTNKEYLRMQKDFEEKYDFRLIEIAKASIKMENLEQNLLMANTTIQNMETKLIRQDANEQNYNHMHLRISQMNELKHKMEAEITTYKKRLETANDQHKKDIAEMELLVNRERAESAKLNDEIFQLKVDLQQNEKKFVEMEAELKRQTSIAHTYAKLDREDKLIKLPSTPPALFNRSISETSQCTPRFDLGSTPAPDSPSPRSTPPASLESDDLETSVYNTTPYQAKTPTVSSSSDTQETPINKQNEQRSSQKRVIPLESYLEKKRKSSINIYKYL